MGPIATRVDDRGRDDDDDATGCGDVGVDDDDDGGVGGGGGGASQCGATPRDGAMAVAWVRPEGPIEDDDDDDDDDGDGDDGEWRVRACDWR